MQPGKKIEPRKRSKSSHPIKIHHLSSFGILNRNGLEIINEKDLSIIEEENEDNVSVFSGWLIPVPRPGYIKVRLHDFL